MTFPVTSPITLKTFSAQYPNLVAWLPPLWYDPGANASFADISRLSRVFSPAGGGVSWVQDSTYGYVLSLNGSSYIECPDDAALNSGSMTLFCRLYITSLPASDAGLICKRSGDQFVFYLSSSTDLGFIGFGSGSPNSALFATISYPTNRWFDVAVKYGPSGFKLFFDGNVVATGSYSADIPAKTGPLRIGSGFFGDNITGCITDVRVYNTDLPDATINAMTTSPFDLYALPGAGTTGTIDMPINEFNLRRSDTSVVLHAYVVGIDGNPFYPLLYNSTNITGRFVPSGQTITFLNIDGPLYAWVDPGATYNIRLHFIDSTNARGLYEIHLSNSVMSLPYSVLYLIIGGVNGMLPCIIKLNLDPLPADPVSWAGSSITTPVPNTTGMATTANQTTILNAVNAITTNTARSGPMMPPWFLRPASDTASYEIDLRLWNIAGISEDADANTITIHARRYDQSSADSHLDSTTMTRIGAGLYRSIYTVDSAENLGAVYFDFSWQIGGAPMKDGAAIQIQDAESLTTLNAIHTQTQKIGTNDADSPNTIAAQAALDSNLDTPTSTRASQASIDQLRILAQSGI